jgi:poly-gamma-glutamate capsule biosynthesis protein CapA/YwtB (metallophosphatase superfamily)
LPPNDGQDLFADVAEWLTDATVTFVNLEGPLCDGGTTDKCTAGSTSCYAFRTPTRYGRYVAGAGVDVASLANNHALDFGEACRGQTEATLDALGIAHSGRPGTVASLDRGGVRIGLVAFHTASHSNNVLDIPAASELVRQVAASHDLVVVSFHGGAEGAGALHVPAGAEYFQGSDRGDLRRFSHAVVDAGADLVIGHGPHVPRAMEVYGGRLVAYSLGNFATYGRFNLSGEQGVSLVLEAQLAADGRFVAGAILPVRLVDGGFPVQDDSGRVVPLVRSLTESDFPSTGVVVGADGTIFPRQAQ